MKPTFIRLLFLLSFLQLLSACENDIEKINLLNTSSNFPNIIGENLEVIYSDSAKVKVKMLSPEIKMFNNAEKPYSEFPQGLIVYFYDDSLNIESQIEANYAIRFDETDLWQARGNVIVQNLKTGERLDSEELFWDEEKEIIYSNTYTRIIKENGTFYGQNGFRSNQSLTDYELIGSSGLLNIKEDE